MFAWIWPLLEWRWLRREAHTNWSILHGLRNNFQSRKVFRCINRKLSFGPERLSRLLVCVCNKIKDSILLQFEDRLGRIYLIFSFPFYFYLFQISLSIIIGKTTPIIKEDITNIQSLFENRKKVWTI